MATRTETMSSTHTAIASDNINLRQWKKHSSTNILRNKFENNFICQKRNNNFPMGFFFVGIVADAVVIVFIRNIYDLLNFDMNGSMENLLPIHRNKLQQQIRIRNLMWKNSIFYSTVCLNLKIHTSPMSTVDGRLI